MPVQRLSVDLAQSQSLVAELLGESDDIIYQPFTIAADGRAGLVVYINGLATVSSIEGSLLQPLMRIESGSPLPPDMVSLGRTLLTAANQRVVVDPPTLRDQVYKGCTALLIDGYAEALVIDTHGWEERPVESPPTESVLRGPRDGFTENIITNIALVRRRLRDPALRVYYFVVGVRTKTQVALLYLTDIAPQELVQELAARLMSVEFDGILDANQLREFLTGQPSVLFAKVESTERPDTVVAGLLAGKAAIAVDNSPFVMLAPAVMIDFFLAPDDYYTVPAFTMMVRLVRLLGWLVTLYLSPLYIALEMYNPSMIRTELAFFLAAERIGVPLTAAIEVYFLELMMEIIHETTIRLPSKVGSAATVVGGLIIGQAAVNAHVISSIVIIVTAISFIGSLVLPSHELAQGWRFAKWLLLLAASFFGIYGLFAASLWMFSWLASQDSFGTPYLAPLAPFIPRDVWSDAIHRLGWSAVRKRQRTFRPQDPDRTSAAQEKKYLDRGER